MPTMLLACAFLLATDKETELAPWAANQHPSDVAKRHVQEIAASQVRYEATQGGTMDGRNCRSPQGVWQPFQQTWESNRSVRMENVGDSPVINPWLASGPENFRSFDRLVASALKPGMSDAEKARALWWQEVRFRFHLEGDNNELLDPVKVFNIYGHNTCGNDSICLAGQWRKAGLKVAPARLVGHCVSQVFYEGAWHLMDGDMHSIYLLRDNETVAGEQDLVRDHDLIRRTHTQGLLQNDNRAGDEWESSIYVFEGEVAGDRNSAISSLDMTLRPGEALVWRWGHEEPVKYHGSNPPRFPDRICNGLWDYAPDFTRPIWRAGATTVESIREANDGLAADEGKIGRIVWTIQSPYIFVGGRLETEGTDAQFQLSWDGKKWQKAGTNLDGFFPPEGPARYKYYLKCELSGPARLSRLRIVNDLQMAPLSLPGMTIGTNRFAYTDEGSGDRKMRITHNWVERSASEPPAPPRQPIHPADGADVEGTDIVFRWQPSTDPDGDRIADYHFELSSHADMRWPLSMSFAKLISRTADAGRTQYALAEPGLLNPDQTYYWRIRAQDDKGVWGPWSPTWRFAARAPAPPRNVTLEIGTQGDRGVLRWEPSPKGRRPVAYRVYASDEKGFSVSDSAYRVTVGATKIVPAEFPGNFVAETSATQLEVLGPEVALEGANKAFYRVVAVDAKGVRSGPSDYAAAPRPMIVSTPVTRARKGADYHYPVKVIWSLGDLRTRVIDGKETMGFWDVERPRLTLQQGPSWLRVDNSKGTLSGTPDRPGRFDAVISVTLERDARRLDEAALRWGIEKVISSGTERVGRASQSFTIEVTP